MTYRTSDHDRHVRTGTNIGARSRCADVCILGEGSADECSESSNRGEELHRIFLGRGRGRGSGNDKVRNRGVKCHYTKHQQYIYSIAGGQFRKKKQ